MHILWLINSSMMLQPTVEAFSETVDKNEIYIYPYIAGYEHLCYQRCKSVEPDLVFFIGSANGPFVANPKLLKKIADEYPLVHVCTDGGCPGWWETLKSYKEENIKTVNIDGSNAAPKGLIDLVTLTIANPKYYKNTVPFHERQFELGFMGGNGSSERSTILHQLRHDERFFYNVNRSEQWNTYERFSSFTMECKGVLNFSRTGSDGPHMHVKNRVVETAMAKACLFEQKGSPLSQWVEKGTHFLEWDEKNLIFDFTPQREQIGKNLFEIISKEHSAEKWLEKVLQIL